jgi:hypothetical protein
MKQIFVVLLIISTFSSCNDHKRNAAKIDEDFKVFIQKFSQDSIFQVSRTDFPLTVTELNQEYESTEKKIKKDEYKMIHILYNDSFKKQQIEDYTQEIKLENNKATIEIRGIENGIMTDIYFEKRNGKWKLKGWCDLST